MYSTTENQEEIKFNVRSFSDEIEKLVTEKNMEYIDAVVAFCETNMVDFEVAASFVKSNAKLKAKIQDEAESLNFLPKSSKLPL